MAPKMWAQSCLSAERYVYYSVRTTSPSHSTIHTHPQDHRPRKYLYTRPQARFSGSSHSYRPALPSSAPAQVPMQRNLQPGRGPSSA
ncbi:hypothetical protein PMIN04_010925 [Paraphaeosphaeria minitans]